MNSGNHKYTNSGRSQDVSVEYKTKDEIIEILYNRLKKSDEALSKIRSIVSSSHRTTNISDENNRILNPLYSTFKESVSKC